ncbi:hypothetical protein BJ165DRAFT_1528005 [Panaeolus papilionaceus]|nr:hypothetical protein BJ165DRAFT_1528005 [Panaeolus papilionaceus]
MLSLFLAVHVLRAYSTPLPTPLAEPIGSFPATHSDTNPRTLWSIVYTCLATTLACTWISMHPNITQNKKWFTPLLMRLSLSLYALFVPEAIVFWAATQWKAACDYEAKYKQEYPHWTISHSFFLLMGGFTLPNDEDGQPEPVPAHRFDELLLENRIKFPSVSRNDILDKSKGDPLAKGFVVLQTFWFVAQCLARFLQKGLVVTQLEVATLALVPINVVIYFFWLKKPLSSLRPANSVAEKMGFQDADQNQTSPNQDTVLDSGIHRNPSDTIPSVATYGEGVTNLRSRKPTLAITPPPSHMEPSTNGHMIDDDEHRAPTVHSEGGVIRSPVSMHSHRPSTLATIETNSRPPPRAFSLAKKIFTGLLLVFVLPALAAAVVAVALPPLLFAAVLVLVLAFVIVIPLTLLLPFLASMQIGAIGRHPEQEAERKLPMLYAPPISARSTNLMLLITTICATVFGGMHLIAWSFKFPTPIEKLLWRISATALTALPIIYFTYHVSHRMLDPYRDWIRNRHNEESRPFKRFTFGVLVWLDRAGLALVWSTLFLLGIPLYSLARLYVLVEAFIALRDLTPGVFLAVNWMKFVPHF